MNRTAIAAFHARGRAEIADSLGTLVTVAGKTFMAHVSTPAPSMNLESGGFHTTTIVTLRWPIGRAPKPSVGDSVLLVSENVSFRVTTARSILGSPLGGEIKVEAVRE